MKSYLYYTKNDNDCNYFKFKILIINYLSIIFTFLDAVKNQLRYLSL